MFKTQTTSFSDWVQQPFPEALKLYDLALLSSSIYLSTSCAIFSQSFSRVLTCSELFDWSFSQYLYRRPLFGSRSGRAVDQINRFRWNEFESEIEKCSNLVRIGNIDCWHIETRLIKTGSFTQFLNDLHHDPLFFKRKKWYGLHDKKTWNNENNEDKANLCLSDSVPASSALER